ncbi:uncharacterized protein EV420DRAFT_606661 [Desarmillaria tabescens]|uniref:F-box domain-containing protein n=1 Tax=Armillaria tabescens TaxID=1929756 RepID=A0AA39N1S5_ARMTA|nr:uncharacterized protein EV420DRAFT_606661 [Desarmillaria tabescens]KAK0454249.1 hypothetical protein EV420DRAFT_606661 [Desarmillaria tabescens]
MPLHSESTHSPSPAPLSHTRIKDLLGCNDPLLEAEKIALRSLVDGAPFTLANLDQQIIEARQTLDSLIQKRQFAECDFDDAETLLHPMRSMPQDVLREIFSHCAPDWEEITFRSDEGYDSLDPRLAPWTISHVSRTWRDVSLSTPHLWTCIKLDFRKYRALRMRALMTKVALLLERSKSMDLFVTLLSPDTSLSEHPAFALLDLSAPRWKELAVYIRRPCLRALSGTSFSRLQGLSAITPSTNQDAVVMPVNTFQKTRSLRCVSITGNETCDSFPLPWSSIEDYLCDSFRRCRWDCLKKLVALKSLEIMNQSQTTFDPSALPQITLPTVKSLRISEQQGGSDAGMISKLIQSNILVLPSLSTLEIRFWPYEHPSFPFTHQFMDSLTTLIIRDAMESPADTERVLRFLNTVPHVEKLVINGRRNRTFFRGLTIRSGKDTILPNLRILQLQRDRQPFPDLVVLDFLESRCRKDFAGGEHGAGSEEDQDASRPRPVFLEEIDLSEVVLIPQNRYRLDDLRQRVRIIYTC